MSGTTSHWPSPLEWALVVLLVLLLVMGPAAHSWFEWRVSRDVARTQSAIEQRLAVLEAFVDSRRAVAPADVLAWLKQNSVPCPPCECRPGLTP